MLRKSLPLLLALTLPALPAQARPPAPAVETAARASLGEWAEFLTLPNVRSASMADLQRNADWAANTLRKHGFKVSMLGSAAAPTVYAAWPNAARNAKTVLFYAHMDGQAVDPREWDGGAPFQPALKVRGPAGDWRPLPFAQLPQAQPEARVFARSAADDKAPIMMLIAAIDALKAQGRSPAVRVKLILDPEEESGSPALAATIAQNAELLKTDAVVMLDGPMHASNRPTIVFGHRSVASFTLTVFGPRGELHSGHYGNFAPNPAQGLATLVASFKDADGRVRIPGFYEGVAFGPEVKAALAAVPDDEAAIRARIGVAANDKVGRTYQEALNYPSLNVTAMSAADIRSPRTIIPATAAASFDIRTVPATPGARQIALVRAYVESQGWRLVDGVPTEAERQTYPKLAAIKAEPGGLALATPLDSPLGLWARRGLLKASGEEPVRIPMMGGSVPSAPLVEGLKAPVILLPLVNADNNQHAANENMRIGNYLDGVRSLHALLTEPY